MKKILCGLACMITLGVGCQRIDTFRVIPPEGSDVSIEETDGQPTISVPAQQQELPQQEDADISIVNPAIYLGDWVYAKPTVFQGDPAVENITISIFDADATSISGEFFATVSTDSVPAVRIDVGEFEGVNGENGGYDIVWSGSRSDSGMAYIGVDGDKLLWDMVTQKKLDYSLPDQSIFYRDRTANISYIERDSMRNITDTVLDGISETSNVVSRDVERVIGSYARMLIESSNNDISFVFLKKDTTGQWRVVMGPVTTWDNSELQREGFPEELWY